MFFTADNMIGAKNDSCLYIYVPESKQEFRYKLEEKKLHSLQETTPVFDSLKKYAFSMLQTTEYLVRRYHTDQKNTIDYENQ